MGHLRALDGKNNIIEKWTPELINENIVQVRHPATSSLGLSDFIYKQGWLAHFELKGEWVCNWPGTEYRLIFNNDNYTLKKDGAEIASGTFRDNGDGTITFDNGFGGLFASNTVNYSTYGKYRFLLDGLSHMDFRRRS